VVEIVEIFVRILSCERVSSLLHKKKKFQREKAAHVGCLSYKLYRLFLSPHSLSVTTVTLGSRLFFILLQINLLNEKIYLYLLSLALALSIHNKLL
jgi:hypothetical protein